MQTVAASEARANFAEILERVHYAKERIAIGRRGKPFAAVVPIEDLERLEDVGAEALRRSEARFHDFADATSDWFWEMDENCRFSYFSDRFTEITGVPDEALLGKTREETGIPELDRVVWERHLSDLAARRSFRDFRHPRTLADGRVVHLSINGKAIFDAAGRFRGYRGTGSDITERKRAEAALRESEALLKQAAQMARMGHWVWDDVENKLSYCSEGLAALRGMTVEAYLSEFGSHEAVVARCHPEDRPRYDREIRHVEAQKQAYDLEYRELAPDGEIRFYRERGEPVLDKRGTLIATVGITQDITEQKRTEEALRRARDELEQRVEARTAELRAANAALTREIAERKQAEAEAERSHALLAAAVEALDEGFVIFDADDRLVMCNSKYREIYRPVAGAWAAGTTLATIADDTARHCIGFEAEDEIRAWVEQRLEQHARHETPVEQIHKDGRWIRNANNPLPNGWTVGTRTDITDMKRADAALRESRRVLHAVIDAVPAMINAKDHESRYIFMNRYQADLYGVTGEEAVGKTATELLNPIYGNYTEALDRKVFATGKAISNYEENWQEPGGRSHVLLATKVPLRDDTGSVTNVVTVALDITDRKGAEEALRESEERFKSVVNNSSAAIYLKDKEGRFRLVNPRFEEWYGVSGVEVIGKTSHDIYPEHYADQYVAMDREVLETSEVCERELDVPFANGSVQTALVTKFPVVGPDGRTIGVGTISTDVTERKRVEEELRESEERYRELFDESPVAIWEDDWSPIKQMLDDLERAGVKDWRGYFNSHRDQLKTAYDMAKIVEISRATIDLYRAESKEGLARMSAAAVVIDEELDAFHEIVLSFLAGQMAVDIESKDMAGDGSEIMVRRRVVIPPKRRDDWSRVIFAIEDITERAQVEEQLRQAQKMEAVGQLTGGVAHDFNNLLAVIMGNAEFLGEDLGEDERSVAAIIKAATRGAELTQRLLAFSRQQPLSPQAVDLGGLVGGMAGLIRRTLGETIAVETEFAEGLWLARADPGQVENALLNLAINARDAMPEGGRLIIATANARVGEDDAAAHMEVKPGDYVMLAVRDTGSGMDPEVLERVYEPFFTTKKVGEGSGLGLSMVYGFAKQSGGDVRVSSEPGRGTTIKLYLPRLDEDGGRPGADAATPPPRGKGETVLVVEDDPDVRGLADQLLADLGYRVLSAADAQAGLRILRQAPRIDLLLSDVVLPGAMSGLDLAAEARRHDPAIKLLFMSGYAAGAANRRQALPQGANLLDKPFRKRELARKMRAALDRRGPPEPGGGD